MCIEDIARLQEIILPIALDYKKYVQWLWTLTLEELKQHTRNVKIAGFKQFNIVVEKAEESNR